MLKQWKTRALVLAVFVGATSFLMGGCPLQDVLDTGGQPAAKPASPSLTFTQPTGRVDVQAGSTIGLAWIDTHPAGPMTILFFYDDGIAATDDRMAIRTVTESATTFEGTLAWDTTGVQAGVYRIGAELNDQENSPVTVYLPYEVVIRQKTNPTTQSTLDLLQPATNASSDPGQAVIIRWNAAGFDTDAKLFLYYDGDLNYTNDNQSLIAVVGPGTGQVGSTEYAWNIPDNMVSGVYHILGRLVNGDGQIAYSYAPGTLTIGGGGSSASERNLGNLGVSFPGVAFDGYVNNGRLGEVLTGGADFNDDGYDDFILVAPRSISPVAPTFRDGANGVGEAYLIFSRGTAGRWPQGGRAISVGTLGGYDLEGTKFVGPKFLTSSAGIQEVLFIDDVDGDSRPEIVFGCPDVNGIAEDWQDYDPLDDPDIHEDTSATPGRYFFQTAGWQEYSTDDPAIDWLTWPPAALEPMRAGMVIYASSQSQAGAANSAVHLGQIGQLGAEVLTAPMNGVRIYPVAGNDNSYWGAQLATVNLRSELTPSLLVARPQDDGGRGSVKVMLQGLMTEVFTEWTDDPDLNGFNTQPATYSLPAPDDTGGQDPDRTARWPALWSTFMEGPIGPSSPANPARFDVMNSDAATAASGHMGHPTNLGLFDGDTIQDAAVSAPDALNLTGIAYIVYGSPSFRGVDVGQYASGVVPGFELRGTQVDERLGHKMIGPGDLNDDGRSEWILSAPNRDWSARDNCGAVVIVPGRQLLYGSMTVDQVIPQLDGAIIYGANGADQFGTYLAVAGDVDRDNYTDFLVSAPGYDDPTDGTSNVGAVYLIYGGPHLVGEIDVRHIGTSRLPGKIYKGPAANAAIGPVAGAGDTDSDYYDDFLIGYPNYDALGFPDSGRVYLIYGGRRQAP